MTLWDAPDCLARCKLLSGRDKLTSDASMTDANWYDLLTAGEAYWKPKLAGQYPYHMFGAPTQLTSSDGGVTYIFPNESAPLAVEVYAALVRPRLVAGQFGDPNADYVWEGSQIRMTTNTARAFASGPYARWVAAPTTINASTDPTLKPTFARQLLVCRAVIHWATRGGLRNPQTFRDLEEETWRETQEALKQSNLFYGDAANRQTQRVSGLGYLLARQFR